MWSLYVNAIHLKENHIQAYTSDARRKSNLKVLLHSSS